MNNFENQLKQAVRDSGKSFEQLEIELKGKRTGDLSRRLKSYGAKINEILNHIGYELSISPLKGESGEEKRKEKD